MCDAQAHTHTLLANNTISQTERVRFTAAPPFGASCPSVQCALACADAPPGRVGGHVLCHEAHATGAAFGAAATRNVGGARRAGRRICCRPPLARFRQGALPGTQDCGATTRHHLAARTPRTSLWGRRVPVIRNSVDKFPGRPYMHPCGYCDVTQVPHNLKVFRTRDCGDEGFDSVMHL